MSDDALNRTGQSDIETVLRAKAGDESAFSQLFERYARPVMSFLFGMVDSRDLAEELMQETFARAFTLIGSLRQEAKFSSWLFGIAKNVARERGRLRLRARQDMAFEEANIDDLLDPSEGPEMLLIRRQALLAIKKGLAALDEERRTAFALRFLAEKSYQEISEITGWSVAKAKTEVHRALLELRKMVRAFI